jgi:hypothetical protein
MTDITMTLTGANGDTITFDNVNYILESDVSGFGRPPIEMRIDESALDGGMFRFSRRGIREVDMPIYILGISRADVEAKMRRLSAILDDSSGTGTIIQANYANGDEWFLEGHYSKGAESQFGESGTLTFARWLLSFRCPNPYWTRLDAQSFSVTGGGTSGRGLFSPNTMANMKVAPSQVLGALSFTNAGDVPAPPTWIFTGPFDSVTVSSGSSQFVYNAAVTAGNTITVNCAKGTVIDQAGVNKYASLSAAPKLFSIQPGSTSVNISAVNTTSASQIQLNFQPRKEVVF